MLSKVVEAFKIYLIKIIKVPDIHPYDIPFLLQKITPERMYSISTILTSLYVHQNVFQRKHHVQNKLTLEIIIFLVFYALAWSSGKLYSSQCGKTVHLIEAAENPIKWENGSYSI